MIRRYLTNKGSVEQGKLSPAVFHWITDHGLQEKNIVGTGPKGRILKGDIMNYLERNRPNVNQQPIDMFKSTLDMRKPSAATMAKEIHLPHTLMRKSISERSSHAKRTIPHVYASIDCPMNEVMQLKKTWNDPSKAHRFSMDDFIIKATAIALQDVPDMNVIWDEKEHERRPTSGIDIAITITTKGGFITPIIRQANSLGLMEISLRRKEFIMKAKEGKLMPEEYQGGSFSISNLGMYGIHQCSEVIHPPQTCILALGSPRPIFQPILDSTRHDEESSWDINSLGGMDTSSLDDSTLSSEHLQSSHSLVHIMTATLSCDQRAIELPTLTRFLRQFQYYLNHPHFLV